MPDDTEVNCAKTAELINMLFMLWTWLGPYPPCERTIIRGNDMPDNTAVSCAMMAEPVSLPFGLWTRVGRRKHNFSRIHQIVPICPHGRAHCRHLVNTIELSCLRRRCGLMSNYFDRLLKFGIGVTVAVYYKAFHKQRPWWSALFIAEHKL